MTNAQTYEIQINTDELTTLEMFLDRITQAARAGGLDHRTCAIEAVVRFEKVNDSQDAQPLEALIDRESRIGGLCAELRLV